MRIELLRLALLVALLCACAEARAQNLPPAFHPPAPMMPSAGRPMPLMPLPPMYYRPSAYQVWQYYGVNYHGQFRPRVIQATQGGYFLYRGYPFPYVNVYPGEHFMPIARD